MSVTGAFYIPKLNPFRFHQYNLGDFWENEIPTPDTPGVQYCQKVKGGDLFEMQFLSAFDMTVGATITLIDNDYTVVNTFTPINAGTYGKLYRSYVKDIFPSVSGVHFIRISIDFADRVSFFSEPLSIESSQPDTLFIHYRHEYPIFDCDFGGIDQREFHFRIEGGLKSDGFTPSGKFTMFNDLDYDSVMLQTQPFNVYKWTFGGSRGVPNWMADIINRAFSVDWTVIDGVRYQRNEGAKLEAQRDGPFPMAGWSLETLLKDNDYSEMFTAVGAVIFDGVWNDEAVVDDTKIFSND